MIHCTEVSLDRPFYWFGATFNFFRSVHSIPTIGFEVTYSGKKIIYSGSIKGALDLDLVYDAAIYLPEYTFIFIGNIRIVNIKEHDLKIKKLDENI